jgi:membrane-bound lytic murein transglycosylase MltF
MHGLLRIAIFAVLVNGCSSPAEVPPSNATPAAVAAPDLIEIPPAPNQPRHERAGDVARIDLDAIAERGYIRVLVARSATHLSTDEDAHSGKAVDTGVALARALSERLRKNVRPVFIETREPDLIPHLLAGKGDVAANLLLTFARDEQVAFAPPIRTGIRELVVTSARAPLVSLEDVGTRAIHVRQESDHHASLLRLNEQLRKIDRPIARIVLAPPTVTDEQLMGRVNEGRIPATIVDDYVFERLRGAFPNVVANPDIAVSQDGSLSWVTRKDAPKLADFLKEFFSTHRLTF